MPYRNLVLGLVVLLMAACVQVPVAEKAPSAAERPPVEVSPLAQAAAEPAPSPPEAAQPAPPPAPPVVVAPPPPPPNLWQRIRDGYQLPNLEGPLVRDWEQWYATRPDYVSRMVERSSRFLYHVVVEV